jgi:hypothetical protein
MEVLTAYVRVHSPAKDTKVKYSGSADTNWKPIGITPSTPVPLAPSPDIQAILSVLSRRQRSFEDGKNEYLDLSATRLNLATLDGAHLDGADLSTSIGLTQAQIDSAIGDKYTTLPAVIKMPERWKNNF